MQNDDDKSKRGADWGTVGQEPFDRRQAPPYGKPGEGEGKADTPAAKHSVGDDRSGADWATTGQAPFDQGGDPISKPNPPPEAGHGSTGSRSSGKTAADDTEVGQPASSPGTRGGASAYGGIIREKKDR